MSDLVFLEPNNIKAIPFTTSDVIAEYAEVSYRSIQRLIENHEKDLSEFQRVRFEITPFETKGGIQDKKIYHLNEEQATLLITYLKNTKPVRAFKKNLVKQFFLMREELRNRKDYREAMKPVRRELTDVIKDKPDHSKWDYKLYTDLSYKATIGKTAAQLRKERGAGDKAKAIDYMTAEEIARVTKKQGQISVLVEMGIEYQLIKEMVLKQNRGETIAISN